MYFCSVLTWFADEPAKIESKSDDVEVEEGNSTVIWCHASGHPPPTITWHKVTFDGTRIREST